MVSIAAFQAVDPGSIPGRRSIVFSLLLGNPGASRRELGRDKSDEMRPSLSTTRPYGAMVARLTPDQKVMCSNHIGVIIGIFLSRHEVVGVCYPLPSKPSLVCLLSGILSLSGL